MKQNSTNNLMRLIVQSYTIIIIQGVDRSLHLDGSMLGS